MAVAELAPELAMIGLAAESPGGYDDGRADWKATLAVLPRVLAGAALDDLAASELAQRLHMVKQAETALAALKSRLFAAAERARVAEADGAVDMVAWARKELGESGREAKRGVEVGRGLGRLPETADALATGELGIEQAEQIVRAARRGTLGMPGEVEDTLLELARTTTPEQLRDEITRREAATDGDRLLRDEQAARRRRYVRRWRRQDGMYEGHFLLDPVAGDAVDTMLRAFTVPDPADTPAELRRTPEQRTADALEQAAHVALDAGRAPANGGERPHVSVIVPAGTLACHATAHGDDHATCTCAGPAETEWSGPISRAALERITCDATLTRILVAGGSELLDVGRATRKWNPAQRRGIVAVDGGCRFPGCDRPPAWSNIHHIRWWRHDGETSIDNGCLLCVRHHHLIHDGGWQLTMDPDTRVVSVTSPDGRTRMRSHPRGAATRMPARRRRTG